MPFLIGLLFTILNICVLVYLVLLFTRLVKGVEHIAEKTDKTSCMLEKMVEKLENPPSSLPPANDN